MNGCIVAEFRPPLFVARMRKNVELLEGSVPRLDSEGAGGGDVGLPLMLIEQLAKTTVGVLFI